MIQMGCLMCPLSLFGFIWMIFVHDITGQLQQCVADETRANMQKTYKHTLFMLVAGSGVLLFCLDHEISHSIHVLK